MDIINQFFQYLSYIGNPDNKIDAHSLKKYLNDDCVIQSNNEILCRGIHEFIEYGKRMQQKYEKVSYSKFLEEPIISGNKAVVHFHVNCLDKSKTKSYLDAIAIITFQNGKIIFWTEVFHEIYLLNP